MNVAVIGGGVTGLYATLMLQQEGHEVTVYEASSRLGGRIYTHHFQPLTSGEDPFFEAGAMRLPLSSFHSSVFDFIRYLNSRSGLNDEIKLLPFVFQHPNNRLLIQGRVRKCGDTGLARELGLPPQYHNQSASDILLKALQPWIDLLRINLERGIQEVLRYDDMTFRHYLRTVAQLPHEVIDFVEMIQSQTNQYDNSFVDLVMQTLHFNTPEWATVLGGMSRMIDVAADLIGSSNIVRNATVHGVEELDSHLILTAGNFAQFRKVYDKVLFAIPPAAIQKLRSRPRWSLAKETAIRAIHEGPLYKMGLHFRRRFWEQVNEPSFGGQDQTDLRIRWVVYPSNDLGSTGSGCLVAYCGMTDALRWSWSKPDERLRLILEDLDKCFRRQGVEVYAEFIEASDARWPSESSFSNTMYLPGQFSRFHEAMRKPEGNVYFAGEHISIHHTWIAGSTDTAADAVRCMLGDDSLKRLGDSSKLDTEPVRFGWQVADGIPVRMDRNPTEHLKQHIESAPTFSEQCENVPLAIDSHYKTAIQIERLRDSSPDSGIVMVDEADECQDHA